MHANNRHFCHVLFLRMTCKCMLSNYFPGYISDRDQSILTPFNSTSLESFSKPLGVTLTYSVIFSLPSARNTIFSSNVIFITALLIAISNLSTFHTTAQLEPRDNLR